MAKGAEHWAREIVKAEMADNWSLADQLRPNLRAANRERRAQGQKSIRATQNWYFGQGGGDQMHRAPPGSISPPGRWTPAKPDED